MLAQDISTTLRVVMERLESAEFDATLTKVREKLHTVMSQVCGQVAPSKHATSVFKLTFPPSLDNSVANMWRFSGSAKKSMQRRRGTT